MRLNFLVYIQLLQCYHPIWSQTTDEPELQSEPSTKDDTRPPEVEKVPVSHETSLGMTQLLTQNIFTDHQIMPDIIIRNTLTKLTSIDTISSTPTRIRIDTGPNIGSAGTVSKGEHFSIFRKDHKAACIDLQKYLMKCNNPDNLLAMGNDVNPLVNHHLLIFAMSTVMESKNYGFNLPPAYQLFPIDFVPTPVMKQVRDKLSDLSKKKKEAQVLDKDVYGRTFSGSNQQENFMDEKFSRNQKRYKWNPNKYQPFSSNKNENRLYHKHNSNYQHRSLRKPFNIKLPNNPRKDNDFMMDAYARTLSGSNQQGYFIDEKFNQNQNKSKWNINKYQPVSSYTNYNRRSPRQLFNKTLSNNPRKEQKFAQQPTPRLFIEGIDQIVWAADLSGTDPDVHRSLAYFREDIGMNSHHWNWHVLHTLNLHRHFEYFVWMHKQMLARYNFERLSLGVPRVTEYYNFLQPIEEGHQPNLGITSNPWYGTRVPYMVPLEHATNISLLYDAWNELLDVRKGVWNEEEWLRQFEQYHNQGHESIGATVLNSERQIRGVMSTVETSARDPVFYRWHSHLDRLWEYYKDMKQIVSETQLTDNEMASYIFEIMHVNLQTDGDEFNQANVLVTGCNYRSFTVGGLANQSGMGLRDQSGAELLMVHLDHVPFTMHIEVTNHARSYLNGVVRIFLAPKYNEFGQEMDMDDQRNMWIELDKFMYNFDPGTNIINRKSQDSAVAVDCTRYDANEDTFPSSPSTRRRNGHCGCGWPQHLLIPRGNENGMPVVLFVMVTEENHVHDGMWVQGRSTYCGENFLSVSEIRQMGFPFHVRAPSYYTSIEDMANYLSNVAVKDVTIQFSGYLTDQNKPDILYCKKNPRPILYPWNWSPMGWPGWAWYMNHG